MACWLAETIAASASCSAWVSGKSSPSPASSSASDCALVILASAIARWSGIAALSASPTSGRTRSAGQTGTPCPRSVATFALSRWFARARNTAQPIVTATTITTITTNVRQSHRSDRRGRGFRE
jgi:hypothetical protein